MTNRILIVLGFLLFAGVLGESFYLISLNNKVVKLAENQSGSFHFKPGPFSRLHDVDAFGDLFTKFHLSPHFGSLFGRSTSIPDIDVIEEKDRYVVKVDMPGADGSAINVTLEDRQLSISAASETAKESKDGKNAKYLLRERIIGKFQRSFTLPEPVDDPGMKTDYKNGVLTIAIPKAA